MPELSDFRLPSTRGESPMWHAIYEIESPDVMKSAAWAEAAERGR